MSNPTKLNFFGLPIDDGVRHSSLSRLKLLARNCRERDTLVSSISSCRNGIRESEAELAALKAEKPVDENADKKAREYAEGVMKETPDPRVLFKNRTIFVVWLLAFGFMIVSQAVLKALPIILAGGETNPIVGIILVYILAVCVVVYSLKSKSTPEAEKGVFLYFLPPLALVVIEIIPVLMFFGSVNSIRDSLSESVLKVMGYALSPLLACLAALFVSRLIDIPLSKKGVSKKQKDAYDNAYAEEYGRLNKESREQKQKHDKAFASTSERLTGLKAKLKKAEAELEKTEAEIENDDTVPEFYKDRDILNRLIMYLENSDADSLVSAVRIFEAHRSQEMFIKYQAAQADLTKIKVEVKEWEKFRTAYNYESKDRAAKIADLNRQAAQNREEANDIYESLGKDKRV